MFLCYLIDPDQCSVRKVNDGFDRAAELTGYETPQIHSLWSHASDPDTSIDVAYSPAADEEPYFRLRLRCGCKIVEQAISGKAVLLVCGSVPEQLASQLSSVDAVRAAVDFGYGKSAAIDAWLRTGLRPERIPAKRIYKEELARHRRGRSR